MRIEVRVHAGSSQEKVVRVSQSKYEVWVRAKAIEGRANEAIVKLLKKHFSSKCKIVRGERAKNKIVEVGD